MWTLCEHSLEGHFGTLSQAACQKGEEINANWMSRLTRYESSGGVYYIKTYASRGRGLRRWFGRSRLRAEWENLQLFASYGIDTAQVIAFGETGVKNYQGVMITRDLARTRDLAVLAKEADLILKNRAWRLGVITRLAHVVQILHTARFVHNDLKWRNILVDLEPGSKASLPKVYLIDCPMGRALWGPLLSRGIIKDLACLDKVAKHTITKTDRLRFYLTYSGKDRLHKGDKVRIRKIQQFFAQRD